MTRAALCAIAIAASATAFAGCGGGNGTPAGTSSTAAHAAACTRPELTTALRRLGTASTVAVQSLRCKGGYALTRVREGERRSVVLWQDAGGTWSQIGRDDPGACPQQASRQKLCTQPRADPALRRCTRKAFLVALRADVDRIRFRVDQLRCIGAFARTRFTIAECLPGQTGDPRGCRRTRSAGG